MVQDLRRNVTGQVTGQVTPEVGASFLGFNLGDHQDLRIIAL
jgi:hypothetical protein